MREPAGTDTAVTLGLEPYGRIADRVADSEFDDVYGYVTVVLEELLAQLEGKDTEPPEQDEEVRDRLRELGYPE